MEQNKFVNKLINAVSTTKFPMINRRKNYSLNKETILQFLYNKKSQNLKNLKFKINMIVPYNKYNVLVNGKSLPENIYHHKSHNYLPNKYVKINEKHRHLYPEYKIIGNQVRVPNYSALKHGIPGQKPRKQYYHKIHDILGSNLFKQKAKNLTNKYNRLPLGNARRHSFTRNKKLFFKSVLKRFFMDPRVKIVYKRDPKNIRNNRNLKEVMIQRVIHGSTVNRNAQKRVNRRHLIINMEKERQKIENERRKYFTSKIKNKNKHSRLGSIVHKLKYKEKSMHPSSIPQLPKSKLNRIRNYFRG